MSKRRKSREFAMQMLYQAEIGKQTPEEVRRTFWQARSATDDDARNFAEDIFRIATERQEEIDVCIVSVSQHWRLERMAAVDRNLLRATVAEMLGYPGTPLPIIINEALEVARLYAAPESIAFLNGILDAVARALPRAAKQLSPKPSA
jgi:N utilization substance protein B